jgi:hypothetical protein
MNVLFKFDLAYWNTGKKKKHRAAGSNSPAPQSPPFQSQQAEYTGFVQGSALFFKLLTRQYNVLKIIFQANDAAKRKIMVVI